MSKPTLVMVHGLVGSLDYIDPAGRMPHVRVETIDLLGYGEFRAVELDCPSLGTQARHVADFIDRLDVGAVWLLGHSMGGAVAMLLADRWPGLVAGIINVEGNFTLKDAFWSAHIARRSPTQWTQDYRVMLDDPPAWLRRCGVEPTETRNAWARAILDHQPPTTVRAMARAIIDATADPIYLDAVRRIVDRGLPVHLIAGRKSAGAWDVPDFVRAVARSHVEQPGVGHLMMLEEPDGFCRAVAAILATA